MNRYCVFILSHGRPDTIKTLFTLQKQGYTGKYFIVIDSKDKRINDYLVKYGGDVIVFDKLDYEKTTDTGDNFSNHKGVVYARNAVFDIAIKTGYENFIVLDDDYTSFVFKFNQDLEYKESRIQNLDSVFDLLMDYYLSTNAVCLAMAQNGDFIGGGDNSKTQKIKIWRKAMNTFFCSTARRFDFMGRINEDVCAYVSHGFRGLLFLTFPMVSIIQTPTQQQGGGMTGLYLDNGTFVKSFYSVMYSPSCIKIKDMGDKHKRLHHKVNWNNAVPCIISEEWRKPIT